VKPPEAALKRSMRVNLPARAAAGEARRIRTREGLMTAAMQVIAHKGPDGASIDDFAVAAGVSRGTFYNYFPTVDDLILALHDHLSEEIDTAMEPVARAVADPAAALAISLHMLFEALAADPVRGWVALRMADANARRQPTLEARFDQLFTAAVESGRFRPNNLAAARNLLTGSFRMAHRDILTGEAEPDHAVHLVALILTAYGLLPEEAAQISRDAVETVRS
jgi:AcrR family transcriptional regulator